MSIFARRLALAASAAALCACAGEAAPERNASALKVGKGGGDAALQTTLAAPAAEGATALTVETIASGLDFPWSIAFLPDGSMLVTERAGRLRVIRDGALVEAPVAGAPEAYVANQAGYFDILPHPDFAGNGVVYLAYAKGDKEANGLAIGRARLEGDALVGFEDIYVASPLKDTSLHFGGKLAWGADGKLYATTGEGSRYKERAQLADTSFGAVIRLNEDGSIPGDNPAWSAAGARPELYTKGHRNPQGLAFDRATGVLYETEHGAKGGDEINVIEPGENYGWPLATYGVDYNGARISPYTELEGTRQPLHYWTPSIAPSGLAVYYGEMFKGWEGDLLVGALAGKALHRIDLERGEIAGEERYLVDRGRIRDVRVAPDGSIYVLTNETNSSGGGSGEVLRITPEN